MQLYSDANTTNKDTLPQKLVFDMYNDGDNFTMQAYNSSSDTTTIGTGIMFGNTSGYFCYAPTTNGNVGLGHDGARWNAVYAASGAIQTSDRNKKKEITPLSDELIKNFVMGLTPSSYKFIENTSDRTHYGLISQDVEDLMNKLGMDSKDFAGFIKSPKQEIYETEAEINGVTKTITRFRDVEGEYSYSLRYDEFIAPLIKMVQMQQKEIDILKEQMIQLKTE